MNEQRHDNLVRELECNFALSVPGLARFRVNVLMQRQGVRMVLRTIPIEIPAFEKLGAPESLSTLPGVGSPTRRSSRPHRPIR